MRALLTAALAGAVLCPADASAQDAMPWTGRFELQYSPTEYLGEMSVTSMFEEAGWFTASCQSGDRTFHPCEIAFYGAFRPPPAHTRYVVVRIYKDGAVVLRKTLSRQQVGVIAADRVSMGWELTASEAGALWLVLAEGGDLTIEFADANGLGTPITYDQQTFNMPALPQRAIELVHTMRGAGMRPREWAEAVLGRCASQMSGSAGTVQIRFHGENFSRVECSE